MQYREYMKKIEKVAEFLKKVYKYRVLIIAVISAVLLAAGAFLGTQGMVFDKAPCPEEIVYGDPLSYEATALFRPIRYEYSLSADFTNVMNEMPSAPGLYYVRGVADSSFGTPRYGSVYTFKVYPYSLTVSVSDTEIVYGETPAFSSNVNEGDTVTVGSFIYDSFENEVTAVAADPASIKITNAAGTDVTSSYLIEAVKSEIKLKSRDITVTTGSQSHVYDAKPFSYSSYELTGGSLAVFGEEDKLIATYDASITDVGELKYLPTELKIVNALGTDVTARYNITKVEGALTVEKRPIIISYDSATRVYDGTPFSNTTYTLDESTPLAEGHTLKLESFPSLTDAGEKLNLLVFSVHDGQSKDVSKNYSIIIPNDKSISVTKRPIDFITESYSMPYDGNEHSCQKYDAVADTQLAEGHRINITQYAKVSLVGAPIENRIYIEILDAEDKVVTTNYFYSKEQYGTLSLTPREITISTNNISHVYDGMAHPDGSAKVISGSLAQTDRIVVSASTERAAHTEGLSGDNIIKNEITYTIRNNNSSVMGGADVSSCYKITMVCGTVSISRRHISIESGSYDAYYDGKEHKVELVGCTAGTPAAGHRFVITESQSVTDYTSNAVKNILSYVIKDSADTDVTDNYAIDSTVWGSLNVRQRPVTITSATEVREYDGNPFTEAQKLVISLESGGMALPEGHKLEYDDTIFENSVTEPTGTEGIDNTYNTDGVSIVNAKGEAVGGNFVITYTKGKIICNKRQITIFTGSKAFEYNGQEQSYTEDISYESDRVLSGHDLRISNPAKVKNVLDGSVKNEMTIKIFASSAKDAEEVTDKYYNMQITCGYIWVTPRYITVETGEYNAQYDGKAHTNESFEIIDGSLLENHELTAIEPVGGFISVMNANSLVGGVENRFDVSVSAIGSGEDIEDNYVISYKYGILKVTPRILLVDRPGRAFAYDGEAHCYAEGYRITSGSILEADISYFAVVSSSIPTVRDIGEIRLNDYELHFTNATAANNYSIKYGTTGNLVIESSIVVRTQSESFTYNGERHYFRKLEIVSGAVAPGLELYIDVEHMPYVQFVNDGKKVNMPLEGYKVVDANGNEIVGYNITFADENPYGELEVTPITISIASESISFVYDGFNYSHEAWSYLAGSSVASGDEITFKFYSVGPELGQYDNRFEVLSITRDGNDASGNYIISQLDFGTITIEQIKITVRPDDKNTIYQGVPIIPDGFKITSGELLSGHYIVNEDVRYTAALNAPGTVNVAVDIDSIKVLDADGLDVTEYYIFASDEGKIEALDPDNLILTIKPVNVSEAYCGISIFASELEIVAGGLAGGHTLDKSTVQYIGEQSVVGSSSSSINKNLIRIYDLLGNEVQSLYTINIISGTLTLTKPEIKITSESGKKVYDGKELSAPTPIGVIYNYLYEGHTVYWDNVVATGKITDVGTVRNVIDMTSFTVRDAEDNDVTSMYTLIMKEGTLEVNPAAVTIVTSSASFEYDGLPHRHDAISSITFSGALAAEGYTLDKSSIIFTAEAIVWGSVNNEIDINSLVFKVTGNPVDSKNFTVSVIEGTTEIEARKITIAAASAEKLYDGLPLTATAYVLVARTDGKLTLVPGDYIASISVSGSVTACTSAPNVAKNAVIKNIDDEDVSERYSISYQAGVLKINPHATITVKTGSDKKYYDGLPLTNAEYELEYISGELLEGHKLEVYPNGTITDIGSVENTFIYAIFDMYGNTVDVYGNSYMDYYTVIPDLGTLEVMKDNSFEPEKNDPIDTEANSPFKVYSNYTGLIYLRNKSMGDYGYGEGQWGFAKAIPYRNATLDNGVPLNYLSGIAMKNKTVLTYNLKVKKITSVDADTYWIPYQAVLDDRLASGNDVSGPDLNSIEYNFDFYNYFGYGDDLKGALFEYNTYETMYREYVYNNYLAIDSDTYAYFSSYIAARGISRETPDIIELVCNLIKSSATYNLDYDKALDAADNPAVAFMNEYKEGVCRHYALAATMLYRSLGIPARYTVGYAVQAKSGEWVDVSPMSAHAWVEVYVDGVGWITVDPTGSSSTGETPEPGEPTEPTEPVNPPAEKVEIKLMPKRQSKIYDGTPLVAAPELDIPAGGYIETLIKEKGYRFIITVSGQIDEIGTAASKLTSYTVLNAKGEDITAQFNENFNVIVKDGVLQLAAVRIKVAAYSLSQTYNGKPLSYQPDEFYLPDGLPEGYTIDFALKGSLTDYKEGGLPASDCVDKCIVYKDGVVLESKYYILEVSGGLMIKPRKVTLSSESKSAVYDGTTLTAPEVTVSYGSLVRGHVLNVTATGKINHPGEVENTINIEGYSRIIVDENGKDVTNNYQITTSPGMLTLYKDGEIVEELQ